MRLQLEIDRQQRSAAAMAGLTDRLQQERQALDEHAIVSMADTEGWIIYANDKFCNISGHERKELLGKNHRILNSHRHPPEFFREMWRSIAAGHPWHGLICNQAKNGQRYWVRSTIVPMRNAQGQLDTDVSIRTDVTAMVDAQGELRRSERELRAAKEEAEEARDAAMVANLQKSTFLANMSHELRTPMNAILGFAQLLQLEEKLGADAQDSIEHIHEAGLHLLTLINEVLDLSRIVAGNIELAIETVDINDALSEVLEAITPVARRKGMALAYLSSDGPPLAIAADRSRLHQVVLNLISNAIKYNRPRGRVEIFAERRGESVRIGVTDTGIGQSPQDPGRLFTPLHALRSTPYRRHVHRPHHHQAHRRGDGGQDRCRERTECRQHLLGRVQAGSGGVGGSSRRDFSCRRRGGVPEAQGELSQVKGTVLYIEDNLAS